MLGVCMYVCMCFFFERVQFHAWLAVFKMGGSAFWRAERQPGYDFTNSLEGMSSTTLENALNLSREIS